MHYVKVKTRKKSITMSTSSRIHVGINLNPKIPRFWSHFYSLFPFSSLPSHPANFISAIPYSLTTYSEMHPDHFADNLIKHGQARINNKTQFSAHIYISTLFPKVKCQQKKSIPKIKSEHKCNELL